MTGTITSKQFLDAAYAAIDTIYLQGGVGGEVSDRNIGRAEGRAEVVFDDRVRHLSGAADLATGVANVRLVPDYETDVLHCHVVYGDKNMSVDLYLGDYGVDLVETPISSVT